MDLRIQKTYTALMKAMQDLLIEKSFEQITVRALCERAVIRTATFYKHFSDKYEFFAFMVRELYQEQLSLTVKQEKPEETLQLFIDHIFSFLASHKELLLAIHQDQLLITIIFSQTGMAKETITQQFAQARKAGSFFPVSDELMTQLFIGGLHQAITQQLMTRPQELEQLKTPLKDWVNSLFTPPSL